MNILRFLDRLFFAPRSPLGFGLMRAAWGGIVFLSTCSLVADRHVFFGESGMLPPGIHETMVRGDVRFSLLDSMATPAGVDLFFAVLLVSSALMAIGMLPRITTVISVVLLWSLHERNPFVFAGGDTVLRTLGLILIVAPSLSAFSWKRARQTLRHPAEGGKARAVIAVPSYAYRLLLWQLIVLYGFSLWEKMSGTMWPAGTAVEAVFHHPIFTRGPLWAINLLNPVTPFISRATLAFHALWLLMLVPKELTARLPRFVPRIRLKRVVLLLGILFHGGIFVMLDAGDFSLAMFCAYLGLLDEDDFAMFRTLWNWRWRGHITVLYDGRCGLCKKSVAALHLFDWGKRLRPVDFRDAEMRKKYAPDITEAALDRSLHIVLPSGRTYAGFAAFRELCEHLPPLLPLVPLLWLPGVEWVGNRAYRRIAEARNRCSHGNCAS